MKKHQFTTAAAKKLIFFLLMLTAYFLQFTVLPKTGLPFSVYILVPLGTATAMHEKEFAGLFWGLLTGMLWDMASPVTDGAMALIFSAAFLITGLLTRYILRNTVLTASILTAVIGLIPPLLQLMYFHEGLTGENFPLMLRDSIIPSLTVTVLAGIPVYLAVHGINAHLQKERH